MTPAAADLAWLAFQYVAGELDAEATAAFERRLADDQEAREAVAEAVGWARVVRASCRPRAIFSTPRRWGAVAAAACLTAMAVGAWRFDRVAPGPPPAPPEASPVVALAWTGLAGPEELLAWLDDPAIAPEIEEGEDAGPPAWLIEAAALGEAPEPDQPES